MNGQSWEDVISGLHRITWEQERMCWTAARRPKMIMLIRSMSPQVIAVDEIGTVEDIHAIEYAMQCGCRMIASVHGLNMDEASNKPVLGDLIRRRMFQRYVVLGNEKGPGEILGIYDERGSVLCRNL